jgi:hypothetical protein
MDRSPSPTLLPIFRSQQQAELLALVLGEPETEFGLTELAEKTAIPYASIHREIQRALSAGLVTDRLVGRTRLVRADTTSPYFRGLSEVLVMAFGVPWVLGQAVGGLSGINSAYIYGSWAARFTGEAGGRPVGDIDLLVLGTPDRDELYRAVGLVEGRLGRPIQVTIRSADWLADGTGTFHGTVIDRPMVAVAIPSHGTESEDQSPKAPRRPKRRTGPSRAPTAHLRH